MSVLFSGLVENCWKEINTRAVIQDNVVYKYYICHKTLIKNCILSFTWSSSALSVLLYFILKDMLTEDTSDLVEMLVLTYYFWVGINSGPEDQGLGTREPRTKDWRICHRLKSRMPSWDSRIWNLASKGKLYNFQMAQIMQWLHAIWNYMKKVKSHISMVFGLVSQIPQLLVVRKKIFHGTRGTNQFTCVPAHISTRHATVYSTFDSEPVYV